MLMGHPRPAREGAAEGANLEPSPSQTSPFQGISANFQAPGTKALLWDIFNLVTGTARWRLLLPPAHALLLPPPTALLRPLPLPLPLPLSPPMLQL